MNLVVDKRIYLFLYFILIWPCFGSVFPIFDKNFKITNYIFQLKWTSKIKLLFEFQNLIQIYLESNQTKLKDYSFLTRFYLLFFDKHESLCLDVALRFLKILINIIDNLNFLKSTFFEHFCLLFWLKKYFRKMRQI